MTRGMTRRFAHLLMTTVLTMAMGATLSACDDEPDGSGTTDTGSGDTGMTDTGDGDTGMTDTGDGDTGMADMGNGDTGVTDSGDDATGDPDTAEDTGEGDAGDEDTGTDDASDDLGDAATGDIGIDSAGDAGDAGDDALPTCTIDFESGNCPGIGVDAICGAEFDGGLTCRVAGLGNCYDSGVASYEITAEGDDLTITFAGDVNSVELFLSGQESSDAGSITFFDAGGNQVGDVMDANGPCNAGTMPSTQTATFGTPVRSAVVSATSGTLWLDTFEINP